MKFFVSSLFSILVFAACAPSRKIVKQVYPNPFEFSITENVPGKQGDIFIRAFEWISKNYGSAKAVVDLQDKEAGKIIGKAMFEYNEYPYGTVNYLITIDARDGKYRCVISDFIHEGKTSTSRYGSISGFAYGGLNKEKVIRRLPESSLKKEDKYYYGVKNYSMSYAKKILEELKAHMIEVDSF